jgi:hypothetical protein
MYAAWDKGDGKSYSAFTNIWKKKEVSMYKSNDYHVYDTWVEMEIKKMLRDKMYLERYRKKLKDDAVIAAFKKNSSFFMRKDGDELIFLREGVTKDNIIDYIIMCGKMLDDYAAKGMEIQHYIPEPPSWFLEAHGYDVVDPL